MKKQYSISEDEEMEMLSKQLDPQEMYVMNFLKGFNRTALKEWGKKGLMNFAVM